MKPLILASTSPYRRELLSRLMVDFKAVAPPFEELQPEGLGAAEAATANARGKAESVHALFPDSLVIGSDQAAEVDGVVLGKPGTVAGALAQLAGMSGKTVVFHTGIALIGPDSAQVACERFEVTLRPLTPREIEGYVLAELPLNCAGSFKIEGLGIALMERLCGDDYTSLIGLPLIRLTAMLRAAGVPVLSSARACRCGG